MMKTRPPSAVVAEGVETEQQADLLLHLHCEDMQGFLVSKPLPAEQFAATYLPVPVTVTVTERPERSTPGIHRPPRSVAEYDLQGPP